MLFVLRIERFHIGTKTRRRTLYTVARCLAILGLALAVILGAVSSAGAATLPVGFAETQIAGVRWLKGGRPNRSKVSSGIVQICSRVLSQPFAYS